MATERLSQLADARRRDESYRRVSDAIADALGPHPSDEDVRALRAYVERTFATATQTYPGVRALTPNEPGFGLNAGDIIAQQDSTEEFFGFLDSHPAADDRDAHSR